MTIKFIDGKLRYFDVNGEEVHEGDFVYLDGKRKKVYLTENNELGTDATNPFWVQSGMAAECEYGIYPFEEGDNVVKE